MADHDHEKIPPEHSIVTLRAAPCYFSRSVGLSKCESLLEDQGGLSPIVDVKLPHDPLNMKLYSAFTNA
jgi:hypothetical protein